jgi:DNA-binding LacI/PurR family transcriptional regulator
MNNRPTAIFSISNRLTIGALKAINQKGLKIPRDISIIGFDELRTAELIDPPLTVVVQPAYEFGKLSIETLVKIIGGKTSGNRTIRLKPELVIRESTAGI